MALTDAQWADAVALAVSRFHTGVTTESQMGNEITAATEDWPTRTLSNADLAYRISRSLANLTGLTETAGPPDPLLGTLGAMAFDKDALAFYGPKTELGWGDARPLDAGPPGPAGPKTELQVAGGFIQWRAVGDPDWINLISTADITGADGREIELGVAGGFIQWRYVGGPTWIDLIALSALNGADGREIELQKSATHIQWRYVGDASWVNLVALTDITGPKGDKGDKGDTGASGSGTGNVNGPATSTNNSVAVWDGTTGTVLSNGPGIGVANAGDLLRRSDGDTRYRAAGAVPQSDVTGLTATLAAKADLVAGKVPVAQLPDPPVVPVKTTPAKLRAGTDDADFATAKNMADALDTVVITPATAATGMVFSGFINAEITMTANLTLGIPSGGFARKTGEIDIVMNATGGWALAFHANYIVPSGFSLQATANGRTSIPYRYQSDGKVRLYNPSKWTS